MSSAPGRPVSPTSEPTIETLVAPKLISPEQIMERCQIRVQRAVRLSLDESQPGVVRDVAKAFLEVHRNYTCYLRAAFANQSIRHAIETGRLLDGRGFSLCDVVANVPAMWRFKFVRIPAVVNDIMFCLDTLQCAKFVSVQPLAPQDPFSFIRVLILHEENSPFHQRYARRLELKRELGREFRSLVGYARGLTKAEFLEQMQTPAGEITKAVDRRGREYLRRRFIPEIQPWQLLARTGYTPEKFWREVKKPNTVRPHKPQLELPL